MPADRRQLVAICPGARDGAGLQRDVRRGVGDVRGQAERDQHGIVAKVPPPASAFIAPPSKAGGGEDQVIAKQRFVLTC
jgi:hypothetical protein